MVYGYVKPEEAVTMINEWVKKATNGLIETMISSDDIDTETDLVLANAVSQGQVARAVPQQ